MKVFKVPDYEQMSNLAADIISAQITRNPASVLGLATGSTPIGAYRRLIDRYNSGGIDLQLLGLGTNGHIGFNEPGADFSSTTHIVRLADSTIKSNRRFFENEENEPGGAITVGIKSIMQAKQILLLVSGENKAHILKKALHEGITQEVPASILQSHPDCTVIADEAALSEIND